jgi:hypothetical protein
MQKHNGKELREERLAKWAYEQFGLTAMVDSDFDDRQVDPKNSPCSFRFTDVQNLSTNDDHPSLEEAIRDDTQNLLKFCQVHECNGFCLRIKNNKR